MARDDPHFRLRFPDDLRSKVEAAAKENHRSMTAEIIARLEMTFKPGVSKAIDREALMVEQIELARREMFELRQRLHDVDELISKSNGLLKKT
ncbi:MAG: Arc family DNA-binding protein [Rhizobiaceae bacterium]|nr:Arc family DNA-binding protein [Rhizobiaceae bacterium]